MSKLFFLTENQETIAQVRQFIEDWYNSEEVIYTKTSGSTGTPKVIALKKSFMEASALASGKYFHFRENERIRLALSPATIGGKMLLLRGLLHNMNIEITDAGKHPLQRIEHPIDFISLVPYQLEYMLENDPKALNSVQVILLGGAPVSPKLQDQISSLPCSVYASYGMTETMSHVALKNLKTQTTFQAIEGVHFSVNESQQLIIHAPMLGHPALLTTDIVDLISEREFNWKGRADFVINSAGIKIHPELIENALSSLIPDRFFIIGEPDDTFGERVVLVIESTEEGQVFPFEKVLSKYEIPKRIYYLPKFIETASGKTDRLMTKKIIDAAADH